MLKVNDGSEVNSVNSVQHQSVVRLSIVLTDKFNQKLQLADIELVSELKLMRFAPACKEFSVLFITLPLCQETVSLKP